MKYIGIIGLEVHIELNTATKMFCRCPNESQVTESNKNVCPICLGHPGTMPATNKEAIKSILRLGIALGGEIATISQFDRKSYFYPDLPKGYQISQYEHPFVKKGELSGVKIRRIHLEEDAGKLIHSTRGETLCDYNRAGVPLIELVTEPDITSGEKAVEFTKELQLALRYLGISSADMENGELRLEANISVRPENTEKLGTKVEVKNLNSFNFMAKAIDYEIQRQIETLERGEAVEQETRGWNSIKNQTFSQRSKEDAHDYRYLPEPDLTSYNLTDKSFIDIDELRSDIPEMPWEKRIRFIEEFGMTDKVAVSFVEDKIFAAYFEEIASEIIAEDITEEEKKKSLQLVANYMLADVRSIINQSRADTLEFRERVSPENMADLIILIAKDKLTSRMAKDILGEMYATSADPNNIIATNGLSQITDEETIIAIIQEVKAEYPKAVEDYKKGKDNALQFLFGQTMAKLKGQGSPDTIKELLKKQIVR